MARTFDPTERPVLKTPWIAVPSQSHSPRIGRTRAVFLFALNEGETMVAEEFRWDFQGTDDWIEVSKLSGAYLQHLHSKMAHTPQTGA